MLQYMNVPVIAKVIFLLVAVYASAISIANPYGKTSNTFVSTDLLHADVISKSEGEQSELFLDLALKARFFPLSFSTSIFELQSLPFSQVCGRYHIRAPPQILKF